MNLDRMPVKAREYLNGMPFEGLFTMSAPNVCFAASGPVTGPSHSSLFGSLEAQKKSIL
jgi:hypothetical protein